MTVITIPEWTLGDRLAKARSKAGLTQEQMADKLDVSHSTVAKWEVGTGRPRDFMERMTQWAEITQVPVTWLLGLEEFKTRGNSTRRNHTGPGRKSRMQGPARDELELRPTGT